MVIITNTSGVISFVSPKVQDMLGYEPKEIVGIKSAIDLHPQEGKSKNRQKQQYHISFYDYQTLITKMKIVTL